MKSKIGKSKAVVKTAHELMGKKGGFDYDEQKFEGLTLESYLDMYKQPQGIHGGIQETNRRGIEEEEKGAQRQAQIQKGQKGEEGAAR